MELRRCGNLHFIQTVEGGLVTKRLNLFRGKPGLKFKDLKDIYEDGEALNSHSLPSARAEVELEELPIEHDRVNAESPCLLANKGATMESDGESFVSSCSSVCDGGETDLDEVSFGTLTLLQIKERCKAKKRKRSRNVGSIAEANETCSPVKQDSSGSQFELEDYEFMEPIIHLKSRILKNRNAKKKCRLKSSFSSPSQSALCVVKSEEIPSDQVIFQSSGNSPVPVDVKTEVPESISSDRQYVTVISVNSLDGFTEPSASSLVVSCGEPEIADGCVLEIGMSIISTKEPDSANGGGFEPQMSTFCGNEPQHCVVNEQSHEYMEHDDLESIHDVNASPEGTMMVIAEGFSVPSSNLSTPEMKEEDSVINLNNIDSSITNHDSQIEEHGTAKGHVCETEKSTLFSNEPLCLVADEEKYEKMKHANSKLVPDAKASVRKTTIMDVAELASEQSSDFSLPELKKEASAIETHPPLCSDESVVASPSKDFTADMHDSQNFSGMHKLWKPIGDNQVQAPDIAMVNSPQYTEPCNEYDLHLSEDGVKDDRPHVEASVINSPVNDFFPARDSNLCSSQDGFLVSTTAEEKIPPPPACSSAARKCTAVIKPPFDDTVTSIDIQDFHHSKQNPPERLLSNRKAISPASQKKLCRAMESSDLDDEEYYKYTRKLCYKKLNENNIGRLGRAYQNHRVDVSISQEHIIKKSKDDRNVFHHKGILKVPQFSQTVPRFGMGCTSFQSCSESAISFSQQQMRDIESITTKLTKELNSMKDIIQEAWHSKVYPATPSKYNADEMKIAIQNATRMEESARRWLSIMARDCNRFCKIMKLTDKASTTFSNVVTSSNVVHKEKRKIVFADEAGGKLCDVKTFENDTASVTESGRDKSCG